jgi:tetratricopeptide (TPR) repeat protein
MSLRPSNLRDQFENKNHLALVRGLAEAGRLREAELVVRQSRETLVPGELIEARFYLASAALRTEDWKQALPLIVANRRALRHDVGSDGRAFAWLGLALARFAHGRLVQTCAAAKLALEAALAANNSLAACLAGEILGPALVMTGQISPGFEALERALDEARQLQRTVSVEHLTVQRDLLRARYVDAPAVAAARVTRLAARVKGACARVSLLLEGARLQSTAGDQAAARAHWRDAAELLPSPAPRRIETALRARLALVTFAEGGAHEALAIARAALQLVDRRRDLIAQAELLDLMLAAQRSLGKELEARATRLALARILARTGFRLPPSAGVVAQAAVAGELNHRQLELLAELKAGSYVDVRWYGARCGVSEVTAFRDLSALVRMGYLARVGKARATRYTRVLNG